jgi:hypothetical protein
VERTEVKWCACSPLEMPTGEVECLVRAKVNAGSGSRNALSALIPQDAVRELKAEADCGLTVDGPNLAAQAIAAGLVGFQSARSLPRAAPGESRF